MKRLKCFPFSFVLAFSLAAVVVNAQSDQSAEFISIDCGLPLGSDYTDSATGLNYVSDADLITGGQSKTILSNSLQRAYSTVRSFPQGTRNCYTLQPSRGTGSKYLIRASFMYGNYDSKNALPSFDIYIGADKWDTVVFVDMSTPYTTEIIHSLSSDSLHICLIKTGVTTPFISTLELRPMNSTNVAYKTDHGSLLLYLRVYFGTATTTKRIRYGDDQYDRIWEPFSLPNTTTISTSSDFPQNSFKLPNAVLGTANTPDNVNGSLAFYWDANVTDQWYFAMHSAEVQPLESTEYRAFDIYINGDNIWKESVVPVYLQPVTYFLTKPSIGSSRYYCTLNKTSNSTLPPLINAVEIYKVKPLSSLSTDETDVEAITIIKSTYAITRDWQGDPCLPQAYVWGGLNCSYQDSETARIISLDLSGSGLTGVIASSISNLTHLKSLDLSNNKLTGQVPDFLSQLTALSTLNLKGNNFTGPIPAQLVEKSNNGQLTLSFDDSDNTTKTNPCTNCSKKKSKSSIVPIVIGIVAGVVVIFAAVWTAIWMSKRKKQQVNVTSGGQIDPEATKKGGEIEGKGRKFAYSEVLNITNNFQRILGKGGFGTVYHGYVGNTQVAVKMLSLSSTQGYKEFQAEAQILMTVHHKNLCSLVGYCNEGTNMGIIYEYMANGNLDDHLSGRISNVLTWEERLRIAIDAAQGLEYLHHGCKPQIIHRDVKTNNILLTETFQAKLADFGLSRAYPVEGGTHVSTIVAGTPGYLDPDYYTSNRLTEKSDVYSFGVVLLEMITGKPAISRGQENTHIVQWVDSIVRNGDVKQAVDPRFRGDYNVNSVWKAVELAMVCASRNSARPTMNVVVAELKECLETELASRDQDSKNSYGDGVASMSMESAMAPMAR